MHTVFCDGKNTAEEMVLRGIDLGLSVMGFSVHSPLGRDCEWAIPAERLREYRDEIARLKKKYAAVLFVLAFLCSMGMGAMAGQDATLAWVNWVEQGINCVGQGLLMWGVIVLHKAGLQELKL